jgi:hypothetical protein
MITHRYFRRTTLESAELYFVRGRLFALSFPSYPVSSSVKESCANIEARLGFPDGVEIIRVFRANDPRGLAAVWADPRTQVAVLEWLSEEVVVLGSGVSPGQSPCLYVEEWDRKEVDRFTGPTAGGK